jgi:hypothetical protein
MRVIYIGPSISSLGLQRFQVFTEIPPAAVDELTLADLFVPVERLREARFALAIEGSVEWIAYRAAVAAFFYKKR